MRSQICLVISIAFLIIVVSCKKEAEEEIKFPLSLKYKSYSRAKMRMWTKDGEILDQQKITSFVGNSFDNMFQSGFYEIKFKSKDSVDLKYLSALEGLWTYKVLDTNNIQFKGDVHLFPGMVFGNQATLDRSFLIYKSNIYTQGIRTVAQPTLLPPLIYRADLGFKAKGNMKKISIPGYLCKLRLYTRGAIPNGHMFGEFNESFLNELQDRDTLVIQVTKNNWEQ